MAQYGYAFRGLIEWDMLSGLSWLMALLASPDRPSILRIGSSRRGGLRHGRPG